MMSRSWRLILNIVDIHRAESIPDEGDSNLGYTVRENSVSSEG